MTRETAVCPACGETTSSVLSEVFHHAWLYACSNCDLQFWHPVTMPDASWYEMTYQGRDQTTMSLEPGHRFFLKDPKAPRRGRLIDLGCGTGNFLAAARDAGFDVTGIEFDHAAVRFAQQHYGLTEVFALHPEQFRKSRPQEYFDVVTFFEVLEHQDKPRQFLNLAKDLLASRGFLALSVPNRCRWQKGVEPLDYPPNHLTRWSPKALRNLLESEGFEILSMRQEPLGSRRAAQVLSMAVPTGLVSRVAGERPATLADLTEMKPEEAQATMKRLAVGTRHRIVGRLVQFKVLAMLPVALILLPYFRLRGYTGLYLYCLARKKT
ncbi:MAG: class I SAM-dependent methyltransferase [Candidatus Acidiferrales bacterium]